MTVHYITYATHDQGTLKDLKSAGVTILGMGKKWNGFMDKFKGVLEYMSTCKDDDIIVFLDGFDSKVIGDPEVAVKKFKSMNIPVLFSITPGPLWYMYVNYRSTEMCNDTATANSGMYMGYVKYLKPLLKDSLTTGTDDDQRAINILCKKHTIHMDTNSEIFYNKCTTCKYNNKNDAPFYSEPGKFDYKRMKRVPDEYYKYFILEIFTLVSVLFAISPTVGYGAILFFMLTYIISRYA